ncbi:PleD family two-component system response regulator [Streptomyces rimosus]|uniref:PleD family two-component system response regulator n=1 Tax=Streptomyces rimosus TaxID=1927 RepID=UPI0037D0EDB5
MHGRNKALHPGAFPPCDKGVAPGSPTAGAVHSSVHPAGPAATTWPAPPRGAKRVRILLVDDRAENLLALEAVLEPLGHELVRATSGEAALKALLAHEYALILLDVQMPRMDGFETAVHIKRRARTRHIPIIFLTAVGRGAHHIFRGYAVGAVDYIVKPYDPWVLRAKVGIFTRVYDINRRLREQNALMEAERRRRSGGPAAAVQAVNPVLAEVDARLRAVEDAAGDLYAQLPVPRTSTAALATAADLAEQLSRLRQYLDLLLERTTTLPGPRAVRDPDSSSP